VTLPFNAFWANLHPNSNIALSYSDDLGRHWVTGNRGRPLEHAPNWSSVSLGFVEDKQWVAVNHIPGNRYQDHVYAAWAVYNGGTTKIRVAVSRDRGQTFSKAVTITKPNQTGPTNEYVYPAVDAAGNVYVSIASDHPSPDGKTIYVARSSDDGVTWSHFVPVVQATVMAGCCLPNTTFRDGILEHFAASPDRPGHLYLVWEDWGGSQFDVKFTQSADFGRTWSTPIIVNDNADRIASDQFQPQVAAGPGGAVAVNFYDRRAACPQDPSILPEHVGRRNFCIDVSLQAFKDHGSGAVRVGPNVRVCRTSPGTPSNPARRSAESTKWPAPPTPTRAPSARSSATTSAWRYRRGTSTRSRSPRTTHRARPATTGHGPTRTASAQRVLRIQIEEVGALEIHKEPDSVAALDDRVRREPSDERRGRPPEHRRGIVVSADARLDVGGVRELHAGPFGLEVDEKMRAERLNSYHRQVERRARVAGARGLEHLGA